MCLPKLTVIYFRSSCASVRKNISCACVRVFNGFEVNRNLTHKISFICLLLAIQGDIIASCDSYGVVHIFDIRTISSIFAVNLGPHPANRLALHPSGKGCECNFYHHDLTVTRPSAKLFFFLSKADIAAGFCNGC